MLAEQHGTGSWSNHQLLGQVLTCTFVSADHLKLPEPSLLMAAVILRAYFNALVVSGSDLWARADGQPLQESDNFVITVGMLVSYVSCVSAL